jgi:hypothetical protein
MQPSDSGGGTKRKNDIGVLKHATAILLSTSDGENNEKAALLSKWLMARRVLRRRAVGSVKKHICLE